MNTPCFSLLATALPRLFAAALAGLSLCQCANSDSKAVTDKAVPRVEWYLASKDPPTFSPKGHALPRHGSVEDAQAEYITAQGRPTRYYIPPGCEAHRQLALRLARPEPGPGFCQSAAEKGIGAVSSVAEVLMIVGSCPWWLGQRMSELRAEMIQEEMAESEQRQARRIAAEKASQTLERFERSRPPLEPGIRNSKR